MQFKPYFFGLKRQARADLADKVGTTVGHLTNFCYGYTKLAAEVCVAIEQVTAGAVCRWELRPEDWFRIWPELIGKEGAPEVPQAQAHIESPATGNVTVEV